MTTDHIIIGVHVQDRIQHAQKVQQILTDYGCSIKTRLGLHEVNDNFCAASGMLLLEMIGEEGHIDHMVESLCAIDGVDAKKMVFSHNK